MEGMDGPLSRIVDDAAFSRVIAAKDLDDALAVVVDEVMSLGTAAGAAIDLLNDGNWRRAATMGRAPRDPEAEGPEPSTLTIPLRRGATAYGLLRVRSRPD